MKLTLHTDRVGFEEEEGGLQYTSLSNHRSEFLASRPKTFKNVLQTQIVSDICKNSLSKLQDQFRSESMRATSLVWFGNGPSDGQDF
ncbi:hypothetical protein QQF64_023631 [Cirrhinus molitorella]|uniref:Uncharacterized protein n=1 Tax=Cirrhinus molitorella TaxID=172907 RepID=A0ABR3NIZ0_9TELE